MTQTLLEIFNNDFSETFLNVLFTPVNEAFQIQSPCSFAYGNYSIALTDQRWTRILVQPQNMRVFSPGQLCFGDYNGSCVGWVQPAPQNYPSYIVNTTNQFTWSIVAFPSQM